MAAIPPRIETDPDVVGSFLSDAAHVPGGFAAGVAFPASVDEVASVVRLARTVLPVGAQSSLTGGATPRGELVLSTRALTSLSLDRPRAEVRAGAGVPLRRLQAVLAEAGLWYPPAPTYDGAFVGGTVATNAAGAATFKYGTTRDWVAALTVVMADGQVLTLRRGDVTASRGRLDVPCAGGSTALRVPRYQMPAVPKVSAGYFARPGMDLVDLFIGAEGTLGVIVDVTLRTIARPSRFVALITCDDDAQALGLTAHLRVAARNAWNGRGPLDVSAIEFMDARSLSFVGGATFARLGIAPLKPGRVLVLAQVETGPEADEDAVLDAFAQALDRAGVSTDPVIAPPGDDASAAKLFELRESVPAAVNAAIAAARRDDPEVQKTGGDFIVPFERLGDSMALYRRVFESRGLDYAVWGHVSDGNLHPNVVPASHDEMARGREALLEAARAVIGMGGSPLAEHGVGRSAAKQQLLRELYGAAGLDDMRSIRRALDPTGKLAPGVLFDM